MSQTTNTTRRRRILAGGLITLAVAGAGLAAASELGLIWDGNFQAGAVQVEADCQPVGAEITVGFSDPTFTAAATIPWSIADVRFSDVDAACAGLSYEIAYQVNDSGTWVQLPGGAGTISGTTITGPTGTIDPQTITDLALTING